MANSIAITGNYYKQCPQDEGNCRFCSMGVMRRSSYTVGTPQRQIAAWILIGMRD